MFSPVSPLSTPTILRPSKHNSGVNKEIHFFNRSPPPFYKCVRIKKKVFADLRKVQDWTFLGLKKTRRGGKLAN